MQKELTGPFLLSRCVESDDLKTNFRINFHRFRLGDYYQIKTENYIAYNFYDTSFGELLIGNTEIGVCYLHFVKDRIEAFNNFRAFFPDCRLIQEENTTHQMVLGIIIKDEWPEMLNLQVKGTDFQYKVWRGLTKIQRGTITTYSELAKNIGIEGSARAVGTAIGANEIAFLIPCHRVIQKTGKLTGFRWGDLVKIKLLQKELG